MRKPWTCALVMACSSILPSPAVARQVRPEDGAIRAALEWIVRHQQPGGYWKASEGESLHDVGATGLCLRALVQAGGAVAVEGAESAIGRAIEYLLDVQDPDTGCFGEPGSHIAFIYDHGIATVALLEARRAREDARLEPVCARAVEFIERARNPYKAWRYAVPPDGNNDMSVTGWMVTALALAADAGLEVDPAAFEGARSFIDEMTDPETWRTGYISRGGYSAREPGANERWPESETEAMTAAALLARLEMGEDPNSPAVQGAIKLITKKPPIWDRGGRIDVYYWHHATSALARLEKPPLGWKRALVRAALEGQVREGEDRGSWDPGLDPWGHRGGGAYTTSMMARALLLARAAFAGRGDDASVAGGALEIRALRDVVGPGESLWFALRAPRGAKRLELRLTGPHPLATARIDLRPLALADPSAIVEVRDGGVVIHPAAVLATGTQRPAEVSWDQGRIDLGRPGSFVARIGGMGQEFAPDEAGVTRTEHGTGPDDAELRAAALAALSVAASGVRVESGITALLLRAGEVTVPLLGREGSGARRLYHVVMDREGSVIRITQHAEPGDLFEVLWPEPGEVLFGKPAAADRGR